MQTLRDRYVREYDEVCADSLISKCILIILIIISICGIVMGSFELVYTNRSYPLGVGLLIPGVAILCTLWIGWCVRHTYNSVTSSPQRQPEAIPDLENPMYGTKTPVKPVVPNPVATGVRKVLFLDEDGNGIQRNPMHQEELPSLQRSRSLSSDSGNSPKKEKKEKKERRRSISDSDLTLKKSSSDSDNPLKKEMQENPMLAGGSARAKV